MIIDKAFTEALTPHTENLKSLHESKPKRKAKDIRLANRMRSHSKSGNKVRKATIRNRCTEGGSLSNRHNVSGRPRVSLHGTEIFPDFSVGEIQVPDLPCLWH